MKILALFLLLPLIAFADSVVPVDEVENSVNIRRSPDVSSEIVGKLVRGASLELVASVEGWHEVQLEDDLTGYLSSDWTRVVVGELSPELAEAADEEVIEAAAAQGVEEAAAVATVEEGLEAIAADEAEQPIEAMLVEAAEEVIAANIEEKVEAADAPVAVDAEEVVVVEDIAAEVEEVRDDPIEATEPLVHEPASSSIAIRGTKNYVVKFRDEAEGGNSQIYDDGNRIGIGTTEPEQRLEVNGSIQIHEQNSSVAGLMITQSTGDTGYIMHNRASTLTIGAGSQDRITIDRDGNVGIAVSRPEHPLEMASGAHVTVGGVWTNRSSRSAKENIQSLSAADATAVLMALEPVVFNYRNEADEDYVGFIAEDVPDLVAVADRESLSAMDIVAVLARVVQAQQLKIRELEERIASQ